MTDRELKKKLCYISDYFAYFVEDFENVIGDDWNDMYYQDNAGEPYKQYDPTIIYYTSYACTPAENSFQCKYSVDEINEGKKPWLKDSDLEFYAGDNLENFIGFIEKTGGKCYELVELTGKKEEINEP